MTEERLIAIYAVLQAAYADVASLRANLVGVSADTTFAIGEALGVLSKAKALVGRDIDDSKRKP